MTTPYQVTYLHYITVMPQQQAMYNEASPNHHQEYNKGIPNHIQQPSHFHTCLIVVYLWRHACVCMCVCVHVPVLTSWCLSHIHAQLSSHTCQHFSPETITPHAASLWTFTRLLLTACSAISLYIDVWSTQCLHCLLIPS